MAKIGDMYRTDDFKNEKHVPVIELPAGGLKAGEASEIRVSVGKEIAHPNKTEHHIAWIALYFQPEGDQYAYQLGKADFLAHGASTKGPDTIGVYAEPVAVFAAKLDKPGTLLATSYCNIHGLWEGSQQVSL
jgi:superoxide reductase